MVLICLLLALAVAAIYEPVRHFKFINYDDQVYVTENSFVQRGLTWSGVKWAFSHSHSSNWHPLTWISHEMDWQLYGKNAGGHHLTNVLFHGLNTLLLFLVFKRMTSAVWRSAFVAALFALHPLHVESVAWVSERKDVLSTFFGLLSLWAYARYVENDEGQMTKAKRNPKPEIRNPKPDSASVANHHPLFVALHSRFYWLALLLFACSLMSKAMLVTLPFVLLLLDFWPLQRFSFPLRNTKHETRNTEHAAMTPLRLLLEKLPFFGLTIASSLITVWAQKSGGSVRSLAAIPLGLRVENALVSYLVYIRRMFWPSGLAIFYPYPKAIAFWQAGGAALLLAVVSWVVIKQAKRRPWLIVGWLWYLGTLVPVLGLIQVGMQSSADRYTYVPLIGLFVMLVWGGADLAARWPRSRGGFVRIALIVLAGCAGLSWLQTQFWRDSRSLFEQALKVTDRNFIAHQNLGAALMEEGQLDRAEMQFKEALRIEPDFAEAENNLGTVLFKRNQLEEAGAHYLRAIELRRAYEAAYINLGLLYAKQENWAEAASQFEKAISIDGGKAGTHRNLAGALLKQGKTNEALSEFERAVRLEPTMAAAHFQAHLILAGQNRMEEAIAHLEQAVRVAPDGVDGLAALAWIWATDPNPKYRNGPGAVPLAEHAANLTGRRDARILSILAAAYAESRRFDEAIATAEKAERICLTAGQTGQAGSVARKLEFYRRQQPYHTN